MRSAWSKRHGGARAGRTVLCQTCLHAITALTKLCVAQKAVVRACRNAIEFNSIPSVERLVPGGRNGLKLKIKIGTPFPVRDILLARNTKASVVYKHGLPAHEWILYQHLPVRRTPSIFKRSKRCFLMGKPFLRYCISELITAGIPSAVAACMPKQFLALRVQCACVTAGGRRLMLQ